jgi:hypothetical protein
MANWRIKARYYEACNCAHGCPCNFNGFPTHGKCEGLVAFAVDEGDREGVDLTGAKVAAAVMWPGAIHEGNGKMALFIDAAENQRDALVSILTAADGGMPWEILAATVSDVKGPFFEPIQIDENRTESKLTVGDRLAIEMETFKNPVTGEPHEVHTVLPTGFIFKDGLVCTTTVARVDADGVSFDHSGNNAYWSEVDWSNAGAEAGAPPTRFG